MEMKAGSWAKKNAPEHKPQVRRNREEIKALILEALANDGDLSMGELAEKLGNDKLTDSVRSAVKELLDNGKVRYLYPEKPNSRKQKICLVRRNKR